MSLCLWLSLSPVSSSKRTKRTSIHVPQTNHTKTTFRAKNLGKLLTKQQEESKPLLQRLQRKKKRTLAVCFTSLRHNPRRRRPSHRQRQSSGTTSEIKAKQSKAKQTTSREGRRTRGSGSCSFPRQVGRTVDTGREKGVQGGVS